MSSDERLDKDDVIHNHNEILLSPIKNDEILSFATTGIDLESISLNEISQTEIRTTGYHSNAGPKTKSDKRVHSDTDNSMEMIEGLGEGEEGKWGHIYGARRKLDR